MNTLPPGQKRCSKCETTKAVTEFYRLRSARDGRDYKRKACTRAYQQANPSVGRRAAQKYYHRNREKLLQESRTRVQEWRKANPERAKAGKQRWYTANRERLLAQDRERRRENLDEYREADRLYYRRNRSGFKTRVKDWQRRNPDKVRQYKAAWKRENPDAVRRHTEIRRARKLRAEGEFTVEDVLAKLELQGGQCYYCRRDLADQYHIDHKIALSKGGSNWPANLCCACPSCNQRKFNQDFWQFRREALT